MNAPAKRCFVISPIGQDGSAVRKRADNVLKYLVKPVCEQLGFVAARADEIAHSSLISRRVMEEILTADLVIADLTGASPNVYYELAVRHFVRKPIVHLIDTSEDLPFDVADLKSIRFDHTDLESVHQAEAELRRVITAAETGDEFHNPISAVLEALQLRLVGDGRPAASLAEMFEQIAGKIIGELQASKNERELLWSKLFDTPAKPPERPTRDAINVTGLWNTNYGQAKLIQEGDLITGKFQFLQEGWVGEINGRLIERRIVYHFHWTNDPATQGVGYVDYHDSRLDGRWLSRHDLKVTYADLVSDPGLFDRGLAGNLNDYRKWNLTRAET